MAWWGSVIRKNMWTEKEVQCVFAVRMSPAHLTGDGVLGVGMEAEDFFQVC